MTKHLTFMEYLYDNDDYCRTISMVNDDFYGTILKVDLIFMEQFKLKHKLAWIFAFWKYKQRIYAQKKLQTKTDWNNVFRNMVNMDFSKKFKGNYESVENKLFLRKAKFTHVKFINLGVCYRYEHTSTCTYTYSHFHNIEQRWDLMKEGKYEDWNSTELRQQ